MKRFKKIARTAFLILCVVIFAFSSFEIYQFLSMKHEDDEKHDTVRAINTEENDDGSFKFTRDLFNQYKSLYPDFVGWMAFDDEFVSEPIAMNATNNDYYLTHWIDGSYSDQGTVFFASGTDVANDQNAVLYGHNVTYDSSAKFSPLTRLVNQEEYNAHHTFKIWYEDCVRTYGITAVCYYDTAVDTSFRMTASSFSIGDFTEYKSFINERNQIKADQEISRQDRWITIQTCRDATTSMKIVLICKEVASEEY